jgi:hypothetical protein
MERLQDGRLASGSARRSLLSNASVEVVAVTGFGSLTHRAAQRHGRAAFPGEGAACADPPRSCSQEVFFVSFFSRFLAARSVRTER